MNILVTGGAGFIGSWLIEKLLNEGHHVRVVDSLTAQIHGAIPNPTIPWYGRSGSEFFRWDLRDAGVLDKALRDVDTVVHLAAETGTGQSMYEIAHYYNVNVQTTAALLEAVATRHRTVRKVVLASSRSVYGEGAYRLGGQLYVPHARSASQLAMGHWEPTGPNGEQLEAVPTPETVSPRPASVYAASKLAIEDLGRVVAEAYDLSVVALRFQNVYGERQSLRNPYTGILSIFSNRMRQDLPINIFEDGQESRDFVHVDDVVRSIVLAAETPLKGFNVFNIGSGASTAVLDMAKVLKRMIGASSPLVISGDYRAGDIRRCVADLDCARRDLGFEPTVDLEAGLGRFVRWVLTQEILEDRSESAQAELSRLGLGRTAR